MAYPMTLIQISIYCIGYAVFDANFDKITMNFCTYIESRRAAGFDIKNMPGKFFDLPHIKPFLPYIAASLLKLNFGKCDLNCGRIGILKWYKKYILSIHHGSYVQYLQNELPAWFIPHEYAGEFVNDLQSYDKTGVSGSKGIQQPKLRRKEISAGAVFV
ncbi:CRAL-TRIO domain-containing protein [Dirofilaria immitis]